MAALFLFPSCAESGTSAEADVPAVTAVEDLRIGSMDDPDYALTWMSALVVGPDGRIFSLHPNEQIVRVFAPDGGLERVLGGDGEGPGEFRRPYQMGSIADTIWILDNGTLRFTRFDVDGELIDAPRAPTPGVDAGAGERRIYPVALLPGGRVYGRALENSMLVATGEVSERTHVVTDLEGTTVDTVLHVPLGRNLWEIRDPADERGPRMYLDQPLGDGALAALAADGNGLWIADRSVGRGTSGSSYDVFRITFDGDTVAARTFDARPPPVTDAQIDSVFDEWVEFLRDGPIGAGASVAELRRRVERDFYRPAARPGVTEIVPGRDGTLWLQEAPAWGDSLATWLVLDSAGNPRRRVTLPSDLRLLAADHGTVWGSLTDELDVPYIVRYRVADVGPAAGG